MARKNYIYDKCLIVSVTDGDTCHAMITVVNDLGFSIQQSSELPQEFRILDLDTPEIFHPRNSAEKEHGFAAKERAEELLLNKVVTAQTYKGDKYGRYLAKITLPDGRDFATVMKAEGFEKRDRY